MKQKIEQLSKGIFEYQLPSILLSHEKIQIAVAAGKTHHDNFIIKNSKGSRMKGVLYSSSRLFILDNDKFIGEENIINYQVNADFVDSGEVINGEISIISDCGETILPFEVTIEPPYCVTSIGTLKDLFQFANLAKTDWLEATQVFQSEEFARALYYYDDKFTVLYQHLQAEKSGNQALEEFLVAIHKKLPLTFVLDKSSLEYEAGHYSFLDKLVLTKNTWGYASLTVSTDVPFITLERTIISTDHFIGNTCDIGFVIQPEHMREGRNYGKIIVESIYKTLVVTVVCHCISRNNEKKVFLKRKKQYISKLMDNYIRFRMNKITAGKYATEAENILVGLEAAKDKDPMLDMYHIHLYMVSGKEAAAKAALVEYEENLTTYIRKQPVVYATILYLGALLKKQAKASSEACEILQDLYASHSTEWMLLWFLLYVDKRYDYAKQQKFDDIKDQFSQGCKSPVLYYEAAFILNEDPSVLKELHVFEIQVVNFSMKYQYLSKEAAMQFTYLAGKEKNFNCLIFRILVNIYNKYPEKDVLTAICSMLIRGGRRSAKYFNWFKLGVEEQVKITEVHEYYIATIEENPDTVLAHPVLTYFAYNSELSDKKKAFLYANIIKHKNSDTAIYHAYLEKIEEFALRALEAGTVNRNMAIIYDEVLISIPITLEVARKIPDIAFCYEIECNNPNIKNVCIVHKEMIEEVIVPLINKRAYIDIYTENAEVFLIDKEGNRYISTVDYTLNKLLHLELLFQQCFDIAGDNAKLLLNLAEKVQYYQKYDESAIELRKRVARIPNLNPSYVRSYIQTLIHYYYDNYEGELLESYLMQIELNTVERMERIKLIEFMIIRDLYNVALKAMSEFGFEGIDVKQLVKLCSRLILNAGGMEKVDVLVAACHYVFKAGKYDEIILKYLADYFFGTTADMFDLWKASKTFEIDTLDLEERLLGQMLFAESYISNAKAVFNSYYRSGVNHKLIRAFLSYYAYKYLLNDRIIEQELFDIMKREANYEENDVCLLAILKWYSTKEQLTDAEVNFIDYQLHRLEQKGMILPFFREFKGNMRIPQKIYDKYYVEYRTDPSRKVEIHYSFEEGNKENGYVTEEMNNVCYGIFVKEFVLFCNESLQYYITELDGENESITESTEVRLTPEQTGGEDTKYYQLNMIIAAREMQDEKTAVKLMESYVKTDYAISQLFHPL